SGAEGIAQAGDADGAGDGVLEGGAVGGVDGKAATRKVDVRRTGVVGDRDAVADAGVQRLGGAAESDGGIGVAGNTDAAAGVVGVGDVAGQRDGAAGLVDDRDRCR